MIARAGVSTGKDSCSLMILVNDLHRDILQYCINKNPHLSRYYFMQMFELVESIEKFSGAHFYITDLSIDNDPVKSPIGDGMMYKIKADLRISLRMYDARRLPYRDIHGGFPEYMNLDILKNLPGKSITQEMNEIVEEVKEVTLKYNGEDLF